MSPDAWETCPFCHTEEAIREDYDLCLNEDGSLLVYFQAVCRECGKRWSLQKVIECVVK